MRRAPLLIFCLATACQEAAPPPAPPATSAAKLAGALSPAEVFERVAPSVFIIEAANSKGRPMGQGSGLAIGAGRVVTNYHVVDGATQLTVLREQKRWPAQLERVDPDHDLALLAVKGLTATAVTLRPSAQLRTGERVVAVGAPRGLELTLSEGLVSSLRPAEDGKIVQTTASISPGSSGGGVFDDQARLIGITTFQVLGGQNLNFALPTEWVEALPRRGREVASARAAAAPASAPPAQEGERTEPLAWYSLGHEHLDARRWGPAMQAFNEALRRRPDYAAAWLGVGLAQIGQGDRGGALKTYEKLQPMDAELARALMLQMATVGGSEGVAARKAVAEEDLPAGDLEGVVVEGRASAGPKLLLTLYNRTSRVLTAVRVQVIGTSEGYDLRPSAPLPSGARGGFTSTAGPKDGWAKVNWAVVAARVAAP